MNTIIYCGRLVKQYVKLYPKYGRKIKIPVFGQNNNFKNLITIQITFKYLNKYKYDIIK